MTDTDSFFRSALGLDITTARVLTTICALGVTILYLYRLLTVVHCMRQPAADFPAPTDRLIWVALAMFVPLGLGAWVYDHVRRGRSFSLLFVVPFSAVAISFLLFTVPVWQRATKFSFDFLGI